MELTRKELMAAAKEINSKNIFDDPIKLVAVKTDKLIEDLKDIATQITEEDGLSKETMETLEELVKEAKEEDSSCEDEEKEEKVQEEKSTTIGTNDTRVGRVNRTVKSFFDSGKKFTRKDFTEMCCTNGDKGKHVSWYVGIAFDILRSVDKLKEVEEGVYQIV